MNLGSVSPQHWPYMAIRSPSRSKLTSSNSRFRYSSRSFWMSSSTLTSFRTMERASYHSPWWSVSPWGHRQHVICITLCSRQRHGVVDPSALKITNSDLHTCFQECTVHSKADATGTNPHKRHFAIDFFHLLDLAKIVASDDKESRLQGQTNTHYVNSCSSSHWPSP